MVDRVACDMPRGRAHRARWRGGLRGTSGAPIESMKIVLLLVFLALGPALADQTPLTPPGYAGALDAAVAPRARADLMRPTDRVSRATLTDDEIARYCGRRS
jgi:hypothetical protein